MRAALCLLTLTACAQEISVGAPDGGAGNADASVTPDAQTRSPDATSQEDAAGTADDATTPDTGVPPPPDAGLGLRFGPMQVPGTNTIYTVWSRGRDEVYAGTGAGQLLAYNTANPSWNEVWHEPGNQTLRRIRGTANSLFIATDAKLYRHQGGVQTDPASWPVGQSVNDLLVRGDHDVLLAADKGNGRGGVYHFDGSAVRTVIEVTDGTAFYSLLPDGAGVLVGSQGGLYRFEGTLLPELIQWPASVPLGQRPRVAFEALARLGDRAFATASTPRMVFERTAGGWELRYGPVDEENLRAFSVVPSSAGEEAYLAGTSRNQSPLIQMVGGAFREVPMLSAYDLWDVWAVDPTLVFASGSLRNSFSPVILRGAP